MVPGKRKSVVLPEAAADELRTDVQEDASFRGSNRESHCSDERVLRPLQHRW